MRLPDNRGAARQPDLDAKAAAAVQQEIERFRRAQENPEREFRKSTPSREQRLRQLAKEAALRLPTPVILRHTHPGPDEKFRMPATFPHDAWIEFLERAGSGELLRDFLMTPGGERLILKRVILLRADAGVPSHFERAWEAVRYRYRTCVEQNDEFKSLLQEGSDKWRDSAYDDAHGEQDYRLDRCLYGFFTNSVSIFDSFAFCLYFAGAVRRQSGFRLVAEPEKITVTNTKQAFRNAFPEASISRHLATLAASQAFAELKRNRNLLAHRVAGTRHWEVMALGTSSRTKHVWRLAGSDRDAQFDRQFIERNLYAVTGFLRSLIPASVEFAKTYKPERPFPTQSRARVVVGLPLPRRAIR
jgi:hypothetical protein